MTYAKDKDYVLRWMLGLLGSIVVSISWMTYEEVRLMSTGFIEGKKDVQYIKEKQKESEEQNKEKHKQQDERMDRFEGRFFLKPDELKISSR